MYRTHLNAFLLTVLALVASFTICSGNNGTDTETGDIVSSPGKELSPQEKGMQPIYKLLHGFLDTVMPHNFYSQDDSPFSKYLIFKYPAITKQNGLFHVMKIVVITGVPIIAVDSTRM